VIEVLDIVITQTKQMMNVAKDNSKELGEAVGKAGFCLQEYKAHGKVEVTVVHSKVFTEEMKKQLPAKVMQVMASLNMKLKGMGRKLWRVEVEVYVKVSKREGN